MNKIVIAVVIGVLTTVIANIITDKMNKDNEPTDL